MGDVVLGFGFGSWQILVRRQSQTCGHLLRPSFKRLTPLSSGTRLILIYVATWAWRRLLGMSVHPTLLYNAFHISQNSQTLSGLESIITSYPSCCQVLLHPIMWVCPVSWHLFTFGPEPDVHCWPKVLRLNHFCLWKKLRVKIGISTRQKLCFFFTQRHSVL